MKYTDYLINGNVVNMDSIQTENRFLKYPIRVASLPVAVIGVIVIGSMIPIAMLSDRILDTKDKTIEFKKK